MAIAPESSTVIVRRTTTYPATPSASSNAAAATARTVDRIRGRLTINVVEREKDGLSARGAICRVLCEQRHHERSQRRSGVVLERHGSLACGGPPGAHSSRALSQLVRQAIAEILVVLFFGHVAGTGTATHIGRFTLEDEEVGNAATLAGDVTIILRAANGDIITAAGPAQAYPAPDFSGFTNVETVTITGGTGRFAGASGSFVLERVVDITAGSPYPSTGTLTGSIVLAR